MPDDLSASARIDAYIGALDPPFARALTHLRAVIRAAAPEAEEIITYSMPGIGQNGPVVSYGAFKTHLSFFPMGHAVFDGMQDQIAPWRTSKGTLQFTPDQPVPDEIIASAVKARLAENAARAEARKGRRRNKED